ncbi:MAG TPA: CHAD domain-containing protein [Leptolyngbyaceae cyanobacterium]
MAVNTPLKQNTLSDWAYLAVEKHFHKSIKHEVDVIEDKDPEALHQMRVGMRRLRTAVTGFAPALDLPKEAQEKNIGKIARTLGELRDLDVLQEALKNDYQPALPKSEQAAIETALDYLTTQRQKAYKKVKSTLEKSPYQDFKQAVQSWLKNPTYRLMGQIPIVAVLPDLLLPQISNLLLHPAWLVGTQSEAGEIYTLDELSKKDIEKELSIHGENLHKLRKQTKRVRYQMELFADFYGSTYAAYLKDMKAVQEVLGQIQDSVVLAEFLAKATGSGSNSLPPKFAKKLAQNRYEAWQKWQILQKRYLNTSIRQSFRSELLRPKTVTNNGFDSKNGVKSY